MNKNKKFGFTLVELLAVIVILAVVILIAVTAVVPRMNNAKKKSFLDEALVYVKAAKEAYVTDPSTECYNISDMGNLVKQTKDGYSGTVFVNEKDVSLNITNGKYYIKTTDSPEEIDIIETIPDKFVSTCSEVKEYDIEYDLPSDATVSGNPSKYRTNDATITLNNPTRPGYKFIGWSSKNLVSPDIFTATLNYKYNNGKIYLDATKREDNVWKSLWCGQIKNGTAVHTMNATTGSDNRVYCQFSKDSSFDRYTFKINTTKNDTGFTMNVENYKDSGQYIFSVYLLESRKPDVYGVFNRVQIEEGTTATDYQEYMEPTTSAKIYRGSTGNKTFISNWEAI